MQIRPKETFTTIRTEGAILPSDLLQRIAEGNKDVPGLTSDDYHLSGERLNEAINRSWNRLISAWGNFQKSALSLAASETGTGLTRERWLLPLFQELGYGRLVPEKKSWEIDTKPYPISHSWQQIPIHLVGVNISLDSRQAGVAGAARMSPHGMVQEFLNRSDDRLWAFVSNGALLRILRDNISLTRQAYVEFDLAAMMEGQVYADFAVLWLLCHQSRVEAEQAETCWLEKWSRFAHDQGTRALDQLRQGVEAAIAAIGSGFLSHPTNTTLKERLREGRLDKQDYYRQVLRLIYRMIFLFVAEDRDLLLDPKADITVKDRYLRFYSTRKLRNLAAIRSGSRHADLYHSLQVVMEKLGADTGCPELGLPPLGSQLFTQEATPDLNNCEISNRDLISAVRAVSFITTENKRRLVDFKNLGAEELGSVYESLLELHPELNTDTGAFELTTAGGHERKTTGSYYTPSSLVQCLIESALDPVVKDALQKNEPEAALLDLKICDPACGSGHFLVAAAHRIAKRLAALRTGDEEPSPEATRSALREVIGRCIYGVDVNPMAVELCKVSLWLEAMEPGKPLSFLDHHIQCGNSLLGATPALIEKGIPDEAFKPIEGDDKEYCNYWKRHNKQMPLFERSETNWNRPDLAYEFLKISKVGDGSIGAIKKKENHYKNLINSRGFRIEKLIADTWCAAFVWIKKENSNFDSPITNFKYRSIQANPNTINGLLRAEVENLLKQYQFFHWHLAFPEIFQTTAKNESSKNGDESYECGFDVLLGNPPWERTAFEEVPYFSSILPEIGNAPTTAIRQKLINALKTEKPQIFKNYQDKRRQQSAEDGFFTNCGRYKSSARGRTNTYALFADLFTQIISKNGRIGIIIPSGIATDTPMKDFWASLSQQEQICSFYDFENQGKFFPSVHRSYKFCLLTMTGSNIKNKNTSYGFFLDGVEDLKASHKIYNMSHSELELVNPVTKQPPVCRTRKDFELLMRLQKIGTYVADEFSAWVGFTSAATSNIWKQLESMADQENGVCKLYEAKMIHHFDHRFATYQEVSEDNKRKGLPSRINRELKIDDYEAVPRFFVDSISAKEFLLKKTNYINAIPAYRDVARSTDERTFISTIIPFAALMQPLNGLTASDAQSSLCHISFLNSFLLDYVARLKTPGIHVNVTICNQLPIISFQQYKILCPWNKNQLLSDWIIYRAIELVFTNNELKKFASDCGFDVSPFKWDEERRFLLRCELDAAFFYLSHLTRKEINYIMETFPIIRKKDISKFGNYRTKLLILDIHDEIQQAVNNNLFYKTKLDPPPAYSHFSNKRYIKERSYELNDLINLNFPGEIISVRLPKEIQLEEFAIDGLARFRFTLDKDDIAHKDEFVIIRHPKLRKGTEKLHIAAGKIISIQNQYDPVNKQDVNILTLKNNSGLVNLRLSAEEWHNFRPLCVMI